MYIVYFVFLPNLLVGLGRMANKEYREFLICLINAQHTKGSFKHHDVCTVHVVVMLIVHLLCAGCTVRY